MKRTKICEAVKWNSTLNNPQQYRCVVDMHGMCARLGRSTILDFIYFAGETLVFVWPTATMIILRRLHRKMRR